MLSKQKRLVPSQIVKRYFWVKSMQWFLSTSSVAGYSGSEDRESGELQGHKQVGGGAQVPHP